MTTLTGRIGLVVLWLALPAAARAEGLAENLKLVYRNHVLGVRHPIHDGTQQFDSDGHPVNAGAAEEWEIYGGILIDKIRLKNDQLHVEGKRVAPGDRVEKGKQVAIFLGKKVNFDIHLAHPLASLDEAQKVLGSVFYLDERDAEHRKPELRRTRETTEAQKVYDSVNIAGVPPRPVYTPEPEFSERARKAKFQGVVVLTVVIDTRGEVSSIKIDRGLGLGLDEKALDGLKKWRFTPATRNGEPVNTRTQVEIDFHLY